MRLPRLLIPAFVILTAGRAGASPPASQTYVYPTRHDPAPLPGSPPSGPLSALWSATHVVVVTARPGGGVRVVESWLGDLKPGDPIDLPELYDFRRPADGWSFGAGLSDARRGVTQHPTGRPFAPVVERESPPIWDQDHDGRPGPPAWNPLEFSPNPRSPGSDPDRRAVLVLRRVVTGVGGQPGTVAYFPAAGYITDCYADLDGDRLRFHGRRSYETWGPAGTVGTEDYRRLMANIARLRGTLRPALAAGNAAHVGAEVAWRLRTEPPEAQSLLLGLLDEVGPGARPAATGEHELWRVQAWSAPRPAQVGAAGAWRDERIGRPAALVPALDPGTLGEARPAVAELAVLWCSVTRPATDLCESPGAESVKRPSEPASAAPPVAVAAQPAPPAVVAAPCVCPPPVIRVAPCPPPVVIYYAPCPPPAVVVPSPCAPRRR